MLMCHPWSLACCMWMYFTSSVKRGVLEQRKTPAGAVALYHTALCVNGDGWRCKRTDLGTSLGAQTLFAI
ncbi:hypothetical protein GN956_G23285 [Arapaima gigas]